MKISINIIKLPKYPKFLVKKQSKSCLFVEIGELMGKVRYAIIQKTNMDEVCILIIFAAIGCK